MNLEEYAAKHGLSIEEEYTTSGEEKGPHKRARARVTATNLMVTLYFDPSRRKRKTCVGCHHTARQHVIKNERPLNCDCCANQIFMGLGPPRGWRNMTLERRQRADRSMNIEEDGASLEEENIPSLPEMR